MAQRSNLVHCNIAKANDLLVTKIPEMAGVGTFFQESVKAVFELSRPVSPDAAG